MPIEICIALTIFAAGITALLTALAVDNERTVKRIFYCSLTAIYVAVTILIWCG